MSITGIRGINNRNPLNVKNGKDPWAGSMGHDEKGHAIFADPIYSVRAVVRQLAQYQLRDKLESLQDIYRAYAPADDGNEPDEYAVIVGLAIKARTNSAISLFFKDGHVRDKDQMFLIIDAMLQVECFAGYELPPETIRAGIVLYERDFCE